MPEKIGHYTVVSELGRGGMGIVYKAREEALDRFVAIKVLTERLSEDDTYLQRFVREAKAAAGVSHPNIVQIFYVGEDGGNPYFVMEHVTGRSLNRVLREQGRIGNPRAAQMILQAAHGLAAAHDHGVIHRDIKPANLMLDDRGMVKIADFGLALPVAAETRLTNTGMLVGTPGYLAPEQCMGEKPDHRTDIYALGVTFYELLAGAPPFRGDSPLALLRQILDEPTPDITALHPEVDQETRRILEKMLAKDRAQRYQSCHEVVEDLESYLAAHGVRSMTAGLATRTAPPTPGMAMAAAVPTQALTSPAAIAAASNAATMIVPTGEPSTQPDNPLRERDTYVPPPAAAAMQPPPPPPVAAAASVASVPPIPPPAKRSSSARTLGIIAIIFAVLVGGGVAASVLGLKAYRNWNPDAVTASTDSTASTVSAGTVTTTRVPPNPDVELTAKFNVTDSSNVQAPPLNAGNGGVKTKPVQMAQNIPAVQPRPVPAPASAPARRRSGIGVAVTGDQGLVGAVSSVLTSELGAATDANVVDAQTLPSTESLVRGGNPSVARLIDRLGDEGLAYLIVARVDPSGERELMYMGRRDVAYSARITLTAYDLATGRPISGASRSAPMEYTSRTADREAEKVVGPLARQVARALND
jgi:serine/threonine-protein kinase